MLLSVLVNDSARPTCAKHVHTPSPDTVAVKEVEASPTGAAKSQALVQFLKQHQAQHQRFLRLRTTLRGLARALTAVLLLELLRLSLGGHLVRRLSRAGPSSDEPLHQASHLWAEAVKTPLPGEGKAVGKLRPEYFPKPKSHGRHLLRDLPNTASYTLATAVADPSARGPTDQPGTAHLEQTGHLSLAIGAVDPTPGAGRQGTAGGLDAA
ncbi:hypothetical protein N2152v2_006691 [Parachlorella kessleri]